MGNIITGIVSWIRSDFAEWPLRFILEVLAWAASIACAITMALTIPNPPFIILYPLFISQCMVFGWAAWTRKSFGMLSNYLLLVSIDTTALIRLILH
jgi:hypothetical protein